MSKVFITAAITGAIHTPTMSEYLPLTPDQIVNDAVKAYEAGAALVHIHVRKPETGEPTTDPELFMEVCGKIKQRCPVVIIPTTGGGVGFSIEERIRQIPRLRPEMATLNMGSMNFGIFKLTEKYETFKYPWEKNLVEYTYDCTFPNTFKTIESFARALRECDTKPECEVYEVGMINHIAWLVNSGLLKRPPQIQFVLGLFGGMPATVENLVFLHQTAVKQIGEFTWSVAAAGKDQLRLCTVAMCMGGNARVGLEDSLYARRGQLATSSADQVEIVVRLARELGYEVGTPDDARQLFGLKGLEKTGF